VRTSSKRCARAMACVAMVAWTLGWTGTAGALPDARKYEMVSPPVKNGADVMPDAARTRGAVDGGAIVFSSLGGFEDVQGTGVGIEYIATRSLGERPDPNGRPVKNGWTTHAITPRQEAMTGFAALGGLDPAWEGEFSPDLSKGVFRAWSPVTTEDPNVARVENLYVQEDIRNGGAFSLASPCPGCGGLLPPITNSGQMPRIAGTSADFSSMIFESRLKLTSDAPAGPTTPKLYKWSDGQLTWVGAIPAGVDVTCGGSGPSCDVASRSTAGQSAGAAIPSSPAYTPGTISRDGSRVFFTVGTSDSSRPGQLYVLDTMGTADPSDDTTSLVNAVESGSGPGGAEAMYWTATPDGSRVYFTTSDSLTSDDTNSGDDLYAYDVDAAPGQHLTRISRDQEPADGDAVATGVIGISDNGDYVYFLADGQLVTSGSLTATQNSIYLWHNGAIVDIGSLTLGGNDLIKNLASQSWVLGPTRQRARVTPDGRHLLFTSASGDDLGGYDQTSECGFGGCSELYVYSADADELMCASCNPSGDPATVDADVSVRESTGGAVTTSHLPQALSDDGRWVFFNTAEALVPEDTNRTLDAYEFDTQTHEVHLLSSGNDPSPSYVLDAAPDGRNVFFVTRQKLVGWDTDQNYDLYDTRVDGGFPEPPVVPPACSDEGCQGTLTPPPLVPGAGSAIFRGKGDAPAHLRRATRHRRALRCRRAGAKKKRAHQKKCRKQRARHRRSRAAHHTGTKGTGR
jgi:hypothetical protein